MPKALAITRADHTASELREVATRSNDADATRRMLALALVREGYKRGEAGKLCGMDPQTLARLGSTLQRQRHRRALQPHRGWTETTAEATVAELVRKGPDLAKHGVVRWRRVDLARVIKPRFNVILAERSVGAMLRRLGFQWLPARPRHPRQDPAAQEAHKKTSPIWSKPQSPGHAREKPIELWWQDECRVGQQGTLTRVWAERSSRPPAPRDQRREWAYIFGAVCPRCDIGAALVLPYANVHAADPIGTSRGRAFSCSASLRRSGRRQGSEQGAGCMGRSYARP